jgi:hypothetical protein
MNRKPNARNGQTFRRVSPTWVRQPLPGRLGVGQGAPRDPITTLIGIIRGTACEIE